MTIFYLCIVKNSKPYNDLGDFLRDLFPYKVQKISLNAGFTAMDPKDGEVVPIAITRHSARIIVTPTKE